MTSFYHPAPSDPEYAVCWDGTRDKQGTVPSLVGEGYTRSTLSEAVSHGVKTRGSRLIVSRPKRS